MAVAGGAGRARRDHWAGSTSAASCAGIGARADGMRLGLLVGAARCMPGGGLDGGRGAAAHEASAGAAHATHYAGAAGGGARRRATATAFAQREAANLRAALGLRDG